MAFRSPGSDAARELRAFLIQREQKRRQDMADALMNNFRMQQEARAQAEAARQIERDKILDQRYEQERKDRLMTQADARATQYQNAELARQKDERDTTQRNLDRADQRAERYLDTELTRQNQEAQRASNERVARINASDRGKSSASTATDDRAGSVIDALDELSEKINTQEGLAARAGGVWATAMARANYDDDVAEYDAVLSGAIPLIARKMGHTGVLTEQDVQSVRAMFPKTGDGKSLRDRKIKRIRGLMGTSGSKSGNTTANTDTGNSALRKIGRFEVIE